MRRIVTRGEHLSAATDPVSHLEEQTRIPIMCNSYSIPPLRYQRLAPQLMAVPQTLSLSGCIILDASGRRGHS